MCSPFFCCSLPGAFRAQSRLGVGNAYLVGAGTERGTAWDRCEQAGVSQLPEELTDVVPGVGLASQPEECEFVGSGSRAFL